MPRARRRRKRETRGRRKGFSHSPATKRAISDGMFGNRNAKKKRKKRRK